MIAFGYLRDFLAYLGFRNLRSSAAEDNRVVEGYVPLLDGFSSFYRRNLYRLARDSVNHPITSKPDATFDILDRDFIGDNINGRFVSIVSMEKL